VDTRGYENPFASSVDEIGEWYVAVEEEDLIRESVRRLILEVSDFQCNNHSLGFIDDKGNWLDTEGADHVDYLWDRVYNQDDSAKPFPMPNGWIKVSNANEFWFAAKDWSEMTFAQFEGMVEMWSQCKQYSRWLQKDVENFYVTFGTTDPNSSFGFEHMEQYTIPQFIDKYVGRRGEDLFYGMLLGEL